MRLVALILILIAPTWAFAQKFNEELTIKELNPIYVSINDYAKGGCWTNIKEVKTYLSDKLELEGATLIDDMNQIFKVDGAAFTVTVNGGRHSNLGVCYGSISIRTETLGAKVNGVPYRGLVLFSEKSRVLINPINFNENLLDLVSDTIEEWR